MKKIKGIFFDLEGALLTCEQTPAHQEAAMVRLAELAGRTDPQAFIHMVDARYISYRNWASAENREAGDFELWDKWLLPELDKERLAAACREMTHQYRQTKGLRRVVPGGLRTVRRLYERGFRLGIVSNLTGEEEVPRWLRETGLSQYFDAVALSSRHRIRKPDPQLYRIACEELGLEPEECASVTGGPDEEPACSRAAGLGACILVARPGPVHGAAASGDRPDCVVQQFPEILDLPILQ